MDDRGNRAPTGLASQGPMRVQKPAPFVLLVLAAALAHSAGGNAALPEPRQLSAAAIPDQIDSSQTTVFVDVSVVPMTGSDPNLVLEGQSVIVENGVIQRIGRTGQVRVPQGAVEIDGRGLYLGPGLAEMHLHIATGGQQAAEDAGLLLIANGVTTVLSMGDGFSVGVPALGDRYSQVASEAVDADAERLQQVLAEAGEGRPSLDPGSGSYGRCAPPCLR